MKVRIITHQMGSCNLVSTRSDENDIWMHPQPHRRTPPTPPPPSIIPFLFIAFYFYNQYGEHWFYHRVMRLKCTLQICKTSLHTRRVCNQMQYICLNWIKCWRIALYEACLNWGCGERATKEIKGFFFQQNTRRCYRNRQFRAVLNNHINMIYNTGILFQIFELSVFFCDFVLNTSANIYNLRGIRTIGRWIWAQQQSHGRKWTEMTSGSDVMRRGKKKESKNVHPW